MKKLLILLLSATTVGSFAQNRMMKAVYSDPAIDNLQITDRRDGAVNTDQLEMGTAVKVQFSMLNNDAVYEIPAGSMQLKLTLGTRFTLATDMLNQQELPLRSYFNWVMKQSPTSKQYIITGTLHRDLPAKFAGKITFMLMPSKAGTSTVVCQLLVSNDRTNSSILSDQAPTNNYLSMSYTAVKPLDIKFIRFNAEPKACMVDLNWAVYDEAKQAKQFVIETSENGSNFNPVQTIPAGSGIAYSQVLDRIINQSLDIRIKAEAENGQYVYSDVKTARTDCKKAVEVFLYPNPVSAEVTELTLRAKNGVFNGKYSIRITDAGGAEVKKLEITCTNQEQAKLQTGKLAAGIYSLVMTGEDGQAITVKLVRL